MCNVWLSFWEAGFHHQTQKRHSMDWFQAHQTETWIMCDQGVTRVPLNRTTFQSLKLGFIKIILYCYINFILYHLYIISSWDIMKFGDISRTDPWNTHESSGQISDSEAHPTCSVRIEAWRPRISFSIASSAYGIPLSGTRKRDLPILGSIRSKENLWCQ